MCVPQQHEEVVISKQAVQPVTEAIGSFENTGGAHTKQAANA